MPIVKTKWTKRLAVTLCTMLLLCAAIPVKKDEESSAFYVWNKVFFVKQVFYF